MLRSTQGITRMTAYGADKDTDSYVKSRIIPCGLDQVPLTIFNYEMERVNHLL